MCTIFASISQRIGCQDALGMESGEIETWQLIASSQRNARASPEHARLNKEAAQGQSKGAWIAAEYDFNAWFQVYLQNVYTLITGVATQGRENRDWRVTSYRLLYWGTGVYVQYYKEQGQSGPFKVTKLNSFISMLICREAGGVGTGVGSGTS